MASDTTVRLRDQRKPGHGWYDNEIYDVFGDELRQDGISVYMTLTRLSWGTSLTMSLREMAGHARMAKDTFARSLERVIALGLVIRTRGATPQSACTYDLVDVKELAGNFLRAATAANRGRSVSPRDTRPAPTLAQLVSIQAEEHRTAVREAEDKCLTGRQIGDDAESVDKKICAGDSATEVSQNGVDFETEVSQDVRHLRQDSRLNTQDKYTPLPPASGGSAGDADERRIAGVLNLLTDADRTFARLAMAATRVMRGCGFTSNRKNQRLEQVIFDALELHCGKARCTPDEAAELAIRAKEEWLKDQHLMRFPPGWEKFFSQGLWCDWRGWPYDWSLVNRKRESQVGVNRS